jgi:hypothetical protein
MTAEVWKILLTSFLSAFGGAAATYILTIPKKRKAELKTISERLSAVENGTRSLLRAEMQRQYLFLMQRGYCLPYDKENISKSYEAYGKLGGNSYISELFGQMMDLPVREIPVERDCNENTN